MARAGSYEFDAISDTLPCELIESIERSLREIETGCRVGTLTSKDFELLFEISNAELRAIRFRWVAAKTSVWVEAETSAYDEKTWDYTGPRTRLHLSLAKQAGNIEISAHWDVHRTEPGNYGRGANYHHMSCGIVIQSKSISDALDIFSTLSKEYDLELYGHQIEIDQVAIRCRLKQ